MQEYSLSIPEGITIQKDNYRVRGPDGEESVDAWEFEAAAAKEATVRWFKRLKTVVQVEGEGKVSCADVIVDMRSHHVGISSPRCETAKPLPAPTFGTLLAAAVGRFAHDRIPIRRVLHQTEKATFLMAVHDPMWWAGTIHKLAEFGGPALRHPFDSDENQRFSAGQLVHVGPVV